MSKLKFLVKSELLIPINFHNFHSKKIYICDTMPTVEEYSSLA